jgi:hypothetical protein
MAQPSPDAFAWDDLQEDRDALRVSLANHLVYTLGKACSSCAFSRTRRSSSPTTGCAPAGGRCWSSHSHHLRHLRPATSAA